MCCVCVRACVRVCVHACTLKCVCQWVCACVWCLCVKLPHVCMWVCAHMHACMWAFVYKYAHKLCCISRPNTTLRPFCSMAVFSRKKNSTNNHYRTCELNTHFPHPSFYQYFRKSFFVTCQMNKTKQSKTLHTKQSIQCTPDLIVFISVFRFSDSRLSHHLHF